MAESAAPPLVLVTGASGFVSTWLIKELLEKGEYRVRGTVRNKSKKEKVQPLLDLVTDPKYPLELVEAELSSKECWGPAVEGCTYVFHVASPFPPPSGGPDENVLIAQAVGGVENVLAACAESGTVKRVVVTSSVAAVSSGMPGNPGLPDDHVYTEDDWSVEDACAPYEKSKLKAERAAWAFVEKLEESKKFELVVVNPAYIQGPLLSAASGAGTMAMAQLLLERKAPALPNMRVGIVDVRDVVAGEIAAMFTPNAVGKRFILCGGTVNFKDFAIVVKEEFQPQGYNIPTSTIPKFILWGYKFFDSTMKAIYPSVNKRHVWSNERMKSELGVTPRPIKQSVIDTCYSMIELGVVSKTPGYLGPPGSRESKPKPTEDSEAEPKPAEDSEAEPKPAEDSEAEPKPAEDSEAEPKPAENSEAEPKPAEDSEAEPKPAEDSEAEPKPAEDSEAEPKPSEDSEAEPKPAEDSEAEPKPAEDSEAEPKPAEDSEAEPKPAEDSEAEPKPAEDSEAEPKPAEDSEAEPKPAEDSEAEPKPAEDSEAEPKPAEDSEAEPKPAEDSEAEPKPAEDADKSDPQPSEGGETQES